MISHSISKLLWPFIALQYSHKKSSLVVEFLRLKYLLLNDNIKKQYCTGSIFYLIVYSYNAPGRATAEIALSN